MQSQVLLMAGSAKVFVMGAAVFHVRNIKS